MLLALRFHNTPLQVIIWPLCSNLSADFCMELKGQNEYILKWIESLVLLQALKISDEVLLDNSTRTYIKNNQQFVLPLLLLWKQ